MPPNTPMIEETSLTRIEEMMLEYRNKIKTSVTKGEKKEMLKKLKNLEKHWNNINDKHINGKHYPERMYHSDTKTMDKKEIFKLIDSVEDDSLPVEMEMRMDKGIDLSGVSPGKDRFEG